MTILEVEKYQKKLYYCLMQQGYRLNEIDSMDIYYYLEMLTYIDEVVNEKEFDYIDNIF